MANDEIKMASLTGAEQRDLRRRGVALFKEGKTAQEVSHLLHVNAGTSWGWYNAWEGGMLNEEGYYSTSAHVATSANRQPRLDKTRRPRRSAAGSLFELLGETEDGRIVLRDERGRILLMKKG